MTKYIFFAIPTVFAASYTQSESPRSFLASNYPGSELENNAPAKDICPNEYDSDTPRLKYGHLVKKLPKLGKEYEVSVEVNLLEPTHPSVTWYSILHLTTCRNFEAYGSRTPGIWMNKIKEFILHQLSVGKKIYGVISTGVIISTNGLK